MMFLSLVTALAVAIFIRNQGIGFHHSNKETRIQKIYTECLNQLEKELLQVNLQNQSEIEELLEGKYSFLVGYNFYIVDEVGQVVVSSQTGAQDINQEQIVDGRRDYIEDGGDKNVFKVSGCDYLKNGYYLYYTYLKYDENDTEMLVIALIGALILFFLLIWGRISYISTIRLSVAQITKGNLSYRVPYQYQNELRGLAEDINHMADVIESEEQKKSEFLTNISHDIRTPLTTILGYLEMIKKERYDSKEELDSYIEVMERKGNFLASMLEDFFQYSKLSSKDIQISQEPFELNELLRQFYEDEAVEFEKKDLMLELELYHKPIECKGDIQLLARVVSNLLSNALKYSKVETNVFIKSSIEKINHTVYGIFSISNIPREQISNEEVELLFQRLYKRDRARSEEGSGLGLSIVKNIVELHDGMIKGYKEGERLIFQVLLKL